MQYQTLGRSHSPWDGKGWGGERNENLGEPSVEKQNLGTASV